MRTRTLTHLAALAAIAATASLAGSAGPATARHVSSRRPGSFTGIPVVPTATGLDIVAGSLALAGNRLYWTQGAVARTALLS